MKSGGLVGQGGVMRFISAKVPGSMGSNSSFNEIMADF